jgi:glutamyl-tRNA reductase
MPMSAPVRAEDLPERNEALQPDDVVVCATSARSRVFEELQARSRRQPCCLGELSIAGRLTG